MFKKIVTELAYSPALAGSLGGYIKRLRDERSKRQIGLIFICLAIVVQLFATLFPPESANANNPDIFIDGGIQSIDEYLSHYDQNTKNAKDLLASLGITRSDIEVAQQSSLPSDMEFSLWSTQNNRSKNISAYSFRTASGAVGAAFYQPLHSSGHQSEVFAGKASGSNKWFGIVKENGNLITQTEEMTHCPSWFSTAVDHQSMMLCPLALEPSLSARTIGSSKTPETVHASDRIAYTLSITNNDDSSALITPAINLEDILEYSRILDNGGGEYDYDTKMLGWPTTNLAARERAERTFIIQLLPTIPSTARGKYVGASYDCTLQAAFGVSITTPVSCPIVKQVEQLTNNLIDASKNVNLIFAASLLVLSSYLYIRSRQLLTELYIIRHNHLGGL